jgi:DNA-binding MarR family transcriptional regulator
MTTEKTSRSSHQWSLGASLSLLYRSNQVWIQERSAPLGLLAGSYPFFFHLSHHPGQTQEELSRRIMIDKAFTARVVKRLEDEGFLRRERDPRDRRLLKLSLTPSGEAMVPRLHEIMQERMDLLTTGFTDEEKELVKDLLGRMTRNALGLED